MTAEEWGLLRFHRESRRYMAGCSWWYFYRRLPRAAWRFFRAQRADRRAGAVVGGGR